VTERTQLILYVSIATFVIVVFIAVLLSRHLRQKPAERANLGPILAQIEITGQRTRDHVSAQVDSIQHNTEVAKAAAYGAQTHAIAADRSSSKALAILRSIGKRIGMSADEVDK
jgi:hypothetical protein